MVVMLCNFLNEQIKLVVYIFTSYIKADKSKYFVVK